MHIEKLEIDNFKSFSNKTEIPFKEGFTAIGGINGSGKSNIIDSILFALGLSSPRALRTESGLSDLICTHNSRNDASVKVVFGLDDGYGSTISFTRKIKKGSQGYSSSYYMDDHPCTLTQIHAELGKYNVSPNSYNVIMQGDVTGLTSCSSVERRKFMDEVAGTADFDRKIDAATKELEGVETRVRDSLLILGEVEKRCEQLKEEREAAIKYRDLKAQKDELENKISLVQYFDFKRILDMVHQNILDAGKNQKEKEKEAEKIDELIEKQAQEYKEISDKLKAEGEDKQLKAKREAEEKKGEISRKQDSIKHTDKLVYDYNKSIEGAKSTIEDTENKNEKINTSIKEKEEKIKALEEKLKEENAEKQRILEEVAGISKSADAYIKQRNELRKSLDELKEEENALLKEKMGFETRLNILNNDLKTAEETKENLLNSKKNFKDEKDKYDLLIEKLTKEKEEATTLQKLTFESLEKNKAETSGLIHDSQIINNKKFQLAAKKDAYKSYGLGEGVQTIMRYGLKGVHAPLSQLADVDVEYQEAIGVALGARSNHVVVDSDHVASQAIEILKSQGRDRATFLPLNKLRKAPSSLPLPKADGVIDYAINLIDFDDIYIDAFYTALGDTLVMQDMTTARKLIGKYRMVTIDGEIFEKSGAMTGGAKRRSTVSFGKMDDKELQSCEDKLKEIENKLGELEIKRKEYEDRLERCKTNFSNASNSLAGAKMELNILVNNNQKSEAAILEQENKIKELTPEIKTITSKLDKLEEKDVLLNEKIMKINDEISEVEKYIDEGELNKLTEMTAEIDEKIKATEKNIADISLEISKDSNAIDLNNMIINQKKVDIEKSKTEIENLAQNKIKFEEDIKTISKELEELENEINELGKIFYELQKVRDKIQEEQLKTKEDKTKIELEIEKIKEQIESAKERRNTIEPQFKQVSEDLKEKGVDVKTAEPETMTNEEITSKIQKLQKKMDDLGFVNMRAIETYETYAQQQAETREKIDTLEKEKTEIQNRMQGYEDLKKETFMNTYNKVSEYFSKIFTELTEGEGRLILENEADPFAGGLTIEAKIGIKDKQKLMSLSGGEKTLTALSLIFAVQEYRPSPFYALDEVDAALDGFNVERIANKISNLPKGVQFVVISQRQQMHERSDQMIGVHQGSKGATKVSGIVIAKEKEAVAG